MAPGPLCPDEDVQPHFAELVGLTAGEALGDERHQLGWHGRSGDAERPQQRPGRVGVAGRLEPLNGLEGRPGLSHRDLGTSSAKARASSRRVRASSIGSWAWANPTSA